MTPEGCEIVHGDCLRYMAGLADGCIDAIITDPPYASGGNTQRNKATPASKYVLTGTAKKYPDFDNDTRDMRAHFVWSLEWMREAYRVVRRRGWMMCFSDWRQLPLTSDALQVAGWGVRGMVVWDKTEASRPSLGMFRNQCEFILIATKGLLPAEQAREVRTTPAGVFRHYLHPANKLHVTGKPVPLMAHLMQVLPAGSRILDPFAGAGSTVLAAAELGHRCVGVELSAEYADIAAARLQEQVSGQLL